MTFLQGSQDDMMKKVKIADLLDKKPGIRKQLISYQLNLKQSTNISTNSIGCISSMLPNQNNMMIRATSQTLPP